MPLSKYSQFHHVFLMLCLSSENESVIQIVKETTTIRTLRTNVKTKTKWLHTMALPTRFIKQPRKEINIYKHKSLI